MSRLKFAFGKLTLELTCADSAAFLNACKNIQLQDVIYCDDLTLQATVNQIDYEKLLRIANKQGGSVRILRKTGVYWTLVSILKRPVLVGFLLLTMTLCSLLPSRILFITVEGNATIPTAEILEAAADCGISFGATRRQVRSEKMKNALLQRIPNLQWAGINTIGCTAVISIREKTVEEGREQAGKRVSSIVASRDGIIQNCTIYQGNPLCEVGQAVKAGQVLVSGYQDCGILIKATQANAEIRALTFRQLQLISPFPTVSRGEKRTEKTNFSLRIGKKRIKFYKDSGNLDTTCGKIYSENCVQLPGGFVLPIAIVRETCVYYADAPDIQTTQETADWLADYAVSHLQSTMVAGEILSARTEIDSVDGVYLLNGKYACEEMIGQVKYEQMMEKGDLHD